MRLPLISLSVGPTRIAGLALAGVAALALTACEPSEPPKPECDVTYRTLAGTQWVMWEAMPGGTNRANPRARMKFYKEDGLLKVDYSVGSPYEMHTYDCIVGPQEVKCAEEPKLFDWCLSLEAWQEGACNANKLREIAGGTELEAKDIAQAQVDVGKEMELAKEKFKDNPQMMARYKASKNFLGNKLQGLLTVRVRPEKCQLIVDDQYMTLHNGERIVDSNPVGTNPFVQDKDGTWLWENCMEGTRFLALAQETAPTDEELQQIDPKRAFGKSDTVHYHYIGLKSLEAEEGCTYTADEWVQWQPGQKGVQMEVVDCKATVPSEEDPEKGKEITKCVQWTGSHTWAEQMDALKFVADDENVPRAFYGLTRYKQCEGKEKEEIDTICAAARIMDM